VCWLSCAVGSISMGVEEFFCGESWAFLVASVALFGVLYGVLGSVFVVLA